MTSRENRLVRKLWAWQGHTMICPAKYRSTLGDPFAQVKDPTFHELREKLCDAYEELSSYIYNHPAAVADRKEQGDE